MKFLSPVYSATSGSLAGLTYAHNRFGMYTRGRAVPTNPNTIRQQNVRAAMASMVVYWHVTMTGAERATWATYANNTPVTDSLGQTQILSAQNMFLRANLLSTLLLASQVNTAPTAYDLGQPVVNVTSMTVAIGVNTLIVEIGGAGTSDGGTLILQIGPPQNPSRTFFKGPYQIAFAAPIAAALTTKTVASTYATPGQWDAAYQPITGDFLAVRLRILYDDGRLSMPYASLITVA